MTPDQQKAIALAQARRRRAEADAEGGVAAQSAADNSGQSWGDWASDTFWGGLNTFGSTVGADAASALENAPAFLNRAGDTMTLGYIGDEASAAFDEMIGRGSYEDRLNLYKKQYEDLGTGGRFAADLVGSIVPSAAGVGVMSAAPTLWGAMGRGALMGAGSGASLGFNQAEGGAGDRLQEGIVGGILGGAIGGAIPVVGDMARRGYRGAVDALADSRIGQSVGGALGVRPETGLVLSDLMNSQDERAVAEALARSGDGAMLADIPALAKSLDMAMQAPTEGAALASRRVGDRAASAGDEIIDALRGGQQGPFRGPVASERAVSKQSRAVVDPLYTRAYNTPIDYSSPQGMAIEELVSRVPPRQLAKAIQSATDEMIYDGLPNPQILADIAEDGTVSFRQMPNVMQLDYIKRAFDRVAEDGKDALTGAMNSEGRFASRVARDIRDATKAAVPEYGEALSQAATGIRARSSIREGGQLLNPNFTVEQAGEMINGATEAEKRLMREGLIAQIEHRIGNIRGVASDQSIDAREAASAWSHLSSANTKNKLEMLFGDEWPALKETMDRAGAAVGLRAETAANSRTFGRGIANEAVEARTEAGALRKGQPIQAARNFVGGVTGASPDAIAALRSDVRGELADVLTRQGGAPDLARRAILDALASNPRNPNAGADIEQIVRALGFTALPQVTGLANEVVN